VSRNIILCADGTWNGPNEPDHDDKTAPPNVFKLFSNLDGLDAPGTSLLANERERWLRGADGSVQQVAKYLNGVGDSDSCREATGPSSEGCAFLSACRIE
jgi:hypothetical protein